jgi:hypothetical protein
VEEKALVMLMTLIMHMTLVMPTTIQMVKAQKPLVASEIAR